MTNFHGGISELKRRNNKILYIQVNRMDSASVRSTLFRALYRKNGYKVTYCSFDLWNNYAFSRFLQTILPPFLYRWAVTPVARFISVVYQYLVLHWLVRFYDGIVIMKFFSFETVKLIREHTRAKLLYDFDDSIWNKLNRPLLKDYDRILGLVDAVSVDNRYLYDEAIKYNPKVFIFPPPAQFEDLPPKPDRPVRDQVVIGWIGSPATSYYLYSVYYALEKIGKKYPHVKLIVAGFSFPVLPLFENIEWQVIPRYDSAVMNRLRREIDIGIFPLFECEDAVARGLCKPVIYMGASIPVVASRFGLVDGLIRDGENGFLCKTEAEWEDKLSRLIEDADLRKKIGDAGFETVRKYSLQYCFSLLEDNFLKTL